MSDIVKIARYGHMLYSTARPGALALLRGTATGCAISRLTCGQCLSMAKFGRPYPLTYLKGPPARGKAIGWRIDARNVE